MKGWWSCIIPDTNRFTYVYKDDDEDDDKDDDDDDDDDNDDDGYGDDSHDDDVMSCIYIYIPTYIHIDMHTYI